MVKQDVERVARSAFCHLLSAKCHKKRNFMWERRIIWNKYNNYKMTIILCRTGRVHRRAGQLKQNKTKQNTLSSDEQLFCCFCLFLWNWICVIPLEWHWYVKNVSVSLARLENFIVNRRCSYFVCSKSLAV